MSEDQGQERFADSIPMARKMKIALIAKSLSDNMEVNSILIHHHEGVWMLVALVEGHNQGIDTLIWLFDEEEKAAKLRDELVQHIQEEHGVSLTIMAHHEGETGTLQ